MQQFTIRFRPQPNNPLLIEATGFKTIHEGKRWSNDEHVITALQWGNQSGQNGVILIYSPCDGVPYVNQFEWDHFVRSSTEVGEREVEMETWLNKVANE